MLPERVHQAFKALVEGKKGPSLSFQNTKEAEDFLLQIFVKIEVEDTERLVRYYSRLVHMGWLNTTDEADIAEALRMVLIYRGVRFVRGPNNVYRGRR